MLKSFKSFLKNPIPKLTNNPLTKLISKRIEIPDDLSEITTYNPNLEVAPEEADMTKEGVDSIWKCVEDLYRTGISPGVVFNLRRNGKLILNRAIGHSHGNGPEDSEYAKKILMTPETPICQFSASKAVTAMLIHLLVERKKINLLDPVCHYIPEFAAHGKENTSIYHVISHHAGIPTPPPDINPEILFDHDACIDMLCNSKPLSVPGRRQAYHAVTGGMILAEIVKRVTGMNIREFLRENIQKPLNFKYFNYGVSDEDIPNVAINYATGLPLFFPFNTIAQKALSIPWDGVVNISNDPRYLKAIIAAGNLVATADEMSQFFQLLLNGGELNGIRIFNPLTIRRAIMESDNFKFDGTMVIPMRYSAGFMLGASPFGLWGAFSQAAYGHIGFINIFCWADPERDISVSLQTTGKCLVGGHLLVLSQLLSAITWYCKKNNVPQEVQAVYSSYIQPIRSLLGNSLLSW
ncbi:MAG: beta-lactamase family protein [Desulfobacterales bacterium]|nr:beta-lactamase family protein [Desulfobacterales bacterium]MBF0395731.1 beta-lactamase family protein [Desulfobacterales bacterium]